MKMKQLWVMGAVAVSVAMVSCKKDQAPITYPTPSGNTSSLGSFLDAQAPQMQFFTLNASTGGVVTGQNGTILNVAPNSFMIPGGSVVSGNVTIQMKEVLSKEDMLFSGKMPVASNGQMLISGGEIFLKAFQGSTELQLVPNAQVFLSVPSSAPSGSMMEFYSDDTDTSSWNLTDSTNLTTTWDSTSNNAYYYFQIDSMNWINCDYFMSSGPLTGVEAEVGPDYDPSNCVLFISFDGINSITSLYNYSNHVYSTGSYYQLPIGMNVTFIAISEINGNYYSAFQSATIGVNHHEMLTLSATTHAQILTDISNLP